MVLNELMILLIPFAGTSLGAAAVFFMGERIGPRIEKLLLGFASGVMAAALVWSLLLPALALSAEKALPWLPALMGFALGILFLYAIDRWAPHLQSGGTCNGRIGRMLLAVTIHNVPEGMAVGVACAGALRGSGGITAAAAMALSMGIAIQNLPEGAIVSMPLRSRGIRRAKAFGIGVLSGAVEPLAGFVTVLLTAQAARLMPYLLAFAAGAMFYVVVDDLIPEAQREPRSYTATMGAALGFALMMALDVALG